MNCPIVALIYTVLDPPCTTDATPHLVPESSLATQPVNSSTKPPGRRLRYARRYGKKLVFSPSTTCRFTVVLARRGEPPPCRHCAVPPSSQVDSPLTAVTERVNARQLWRHDSANQLWLWVICSTGHKAFNRVIRNVSFTVKQCHKVNTVECLGKVEKNTSRVLSVFQSLDNHIDKWHNCLSITFSETKWVTRKLTVYP